MTLLCDSAVVCSRSITFFFQAEAGIRAPLVTGVQTCALPILPTVIRVADLEVNIEAQRVKRAGCPIDLTAKEFSLLEFFVLHAGQVVDRASITAHVWDDNHDPFTNVLEVLVRRLRKKLDDEFEPKLLQTLRGAGYRFG